MNELKPLGIYVHIPFCRSKCEYCDFYSIGGSRDKRLVDDYLANENLLLKGQPTVGWCAGELCLSANYFGDLVRKELGSTAKDFITQKVIALAKQQLRASNASITAISDRLGFSSVSHFTRLFKASTGKTPTEFRHTA